MEDTGIWSDCSESSRNSEYASSNISASSSLSEYQNEFLELKQLTNTKNGTFKKTSSSTNTPTWYETHIQELTHQLQTSLKTNENYKRDIRNLEKTNLLCSEKIEKLLKQNKQLEDNLSTANNQIERLIQIYHTKNDEEKNILLGEKILQVERENLKITNQNYLLSSQINQCNFEKNEVETEYKSLKSELEDLKLELGAKVNIVTELKKKISEQHSELQEVSQNNIKLSHSLDLISNELECVKKSGNWYKNELRQCQQEKRNLFEKNLEKEKTIVFQEDIIEQLKLELSSLKCTYDEVRLVSLKEKEKTLQQLEIDKDKDKNVTDPKNNHYDINADVDSITKHYESIINDLTNDVIKIKSDFEHQQRCFENISKEKSDISGKYSLLQSSLTEKENLIMKLENLTRELKEKLETTVNLQANQTFELLKLRQNSAKLKFEIELKNKDKEMFERSVKTIREQFKMFTGKYMQLRDEVHKKNKQILDLQYENQNLSKEYNKKNCELRVLVERRDSEVEELKQRVKFLETVENRLKSDGSRQLETIENLNLEVAKLEEKLKNLENVELLEKKNLELTSVDIRDVMKILKLCKINETEYSECIKSCDNFSPKSDKSVCVKTLLDKIETYLQYVQTGKTTDKGRKSLRRNITARLSKLEEKCKLLEAKNDQNIKMIKSLCDQNCNDHIEEIQRLQTLLQVKVQEDKDKQKRFERNNRTLLRKVKEHMKGRKSAEKHNSYLQELHNNSSEKCNTLQLKVDLLNSELMELRNNKENYERTIEKMKSALRPCEKCANFETLKRREIELEKSLKNFENSETTIKAEILLKEEFIEKLQHENGRLLNEIFSKNEENKKNLSEMEMTRQENKKLNSKLANFENELTEEKSINEQLKRDLIFLENKITKALSENSHLNCEINHLTEKNTHLIQEIKHLNSCLQRKSEEANELQNQRDRSVSRCLEKETNLQNLITNLKNQLHVLKAENATLNNEKFFLQRLCNDLKVALKNHAIHNQSLKDFVEKMSENRTKTDIRPTILSSFPSPVKCDDMYLNKLLRENEIPFQEKPFFDIQESLDTLKKEILFLQKQIAFKNVN